MPTHTICETCARGTARDCAFIGGSNPMVGLARVGISEENVVVRIFTYGDKKNTVYRILKCPSYKRGPIPPLQGVV